jgi:hypothetical protein
MPNRFPLPVEDDDRAVSYTEEMQIAIYEGALIAKARLMLEKMHKAIEKEKKEQEGGEADDT